MRHSVVRNRRQVYRNTLSLTITIAVVAVVLVGFMVGTDNDLYLKIYKGIDTFGKVYKEVAMNYVDEIDPTVFVRAGIDGMLKTLDPYTVYLGERESDEIDLVTNGKYGGVGITISPRDGSIIVVNLLEGFSAAKQGIQIGDKILEIDGKDISDISFHEVRLLVRGPAGTELRMKVEREGEENPIEFVLLREEISVKNVTFVGYVDNGIGYIKLERFSRTAGDDVRQAIRELTVNGSLKGIILDLRDNPGGLLDMAVDVAAKFLPQGSLVVTTKGRREGSDRTYHTSERPLVENAPLAVLVNKGSASASEIVAGAVQDLDRGIIVGTRTFGKGLVQTITHLSENTSIKITTGRYFTPSGRSIQAVDYSNHSGDGSALVIPDSLRKMFRTAHNREVFGSGGIKPDSTVLDDEPSQLAVELIRRALIFRYANHFAARTKTLSDQFEVNADILSDFESYVKNKGFEYEEQSEKMLVELKKTAGDENYGKQFFEQLQHLTSTLQKERTRAFERHRRELKRLLREAIIGRMKGEKTKIASRLHDDSQLQVAMTLLKNSSHYEKMLMGMN